MEKSKDKLKKVILTFDYELFFKESGSVEKSILEPTNKIIDALDKVGGYATFFIDTIFLKRLQTENEKTKSEYNQIKKQLQSLVQRGHRIELHLHPHWFDAIYNKAYNNWHFLNYERYTIHSLEDDKIDLVFNEGIELLNSIANEVDKSYKVKAYRAGGWCVEPFDRLYNAFENNNILIDSSIIPKLAINNGVHKVRFDWIESSDIYHFSKDIRESDIQGKFLEVPVSIYNASIIDKFVWLIMKFLRKSDAVIFGDGEGIAISERKSIFNKLIILLRQRIVQNYSLDGFIYIDGLGRRLQREKSDMIVIVSHPKLLSQSSINFILQSKKWFIDFCTILNAVE